MAEMTDKEVEERLDKYRSGKKTRRFVTIGGVIAAAVIILGGIAYHGHCVRVEEQRRIAEEQRRIEELKAKPLHNWTEEEKERYREIYDARFKNEPVNWAGIFKTGVYSPVGDVTIEGVWIKKFLIFTALLTVICWVSIALGLRFRLVWLASYLCSSLLSLGLAYIVILWLWRLLVQ